MLILEFRDPKAWPRTFVERRAVSYWPKSQCVLAARPIRLVYMVSGELISAITHDLRQPLTAVEMNLSAAILLLERPVPQLVDALDALTDALEQQRRIRDALQVLQHLASQPLVKQDALDLAELTREVMGLVTRDSIARNVPLEFHLEGQPQAIAGDVVLVRQALVSIVRDAIDATAIHADPSPKPPVRVTVRSTTPAKSAADKSTAEVHVMHRGAHRASGTSSWNLALARSVVAAHGATIEFEGEPPGDAAVITRWPTRPPEPSSANGLSDR